MVIKIILISLTILVLLLLLTTYICFYKVFYSSKKQKNFKDEYPIPEGEIYEPFRDKMVFYIKKNAI